MEDLQNLLEKINRDGVEKAEAEAQRILADARAKAEACRTAAREEAAKLRAAAEKDASDYATRAAETVRQAARDTLLKVEASVTALLENLLVKGVDAALSDESVLTGLVAEAVKGLAGAGEVAVGPKLAAALKAKLAGAGNVTVVTDESLGTGFSVRTDGGRVEHSFTGETIAAELAKRLRPDLAALLK